jgi:Zn-dependent protease
MNLILFALLAIPLMPWAGWIDAKVPAEQWTTAQKFVAAMCFLQLLSVILNLIPVPPLDGFGIIAPYLDEDLRLKLSTPPTSTLLFMGYFLLLWQAPGFLRSIVMLMRGIMGKDLFDVAYEGMRVVFWT